MATCPRCTADIPYTGLLDHIRLLHPDLDVNDVFVVEDLTGDPGDAWYMTPGGSLVVITRPEVWT
jgi:hypothetical protein